jgi:hypothetical protein
MGELSPESSSMERVRARLGMRTLTAMKGRTGLGAHRTRVHGRNRVCEVGVTPFERAACELASRLMRRASEARGPAEISATGYG